MLETLFFILVALGLIIDVIVWKKRDLAFCIFYFEIIWMLLVSFVPYEPGEFGYLLYFYIA